MICFMITWILEVNLQNFSKQNIVHQNHVFIYRMFQANIEYLWRTKPYRNVYQQFFNMFYWKIKKISIAHNSPSVDPRCRGLLSSGRHPEHTESTPEFLCTLSACLCCSLIITGAKSFTYFLLPRHTHSLLHPYLSIYISRHHPSSSSESTPIHRRYSDWKHSLQHCCCCCRVDCCCAMTLIFSET